MAKRCMFRFRLAIVFRSCLTLKLFLSLSSVVVFVAVLCWLILCRSLRMSLLCALLLCLLREEVVVCGVVLAMRMMCRSSVCMQLLVSFDVLAQKSSRSFMVFGHHPLRDGSCGGRVWACLCVVCRTPVRVKAHTT